MSDDLIKREDAIKAVEECLKLLARPRYTVKTAIEAIPSVNIPHSDDWEKYSDKLWKNAYERGKADRPQEWIPCSEKMPEEDGDYLVSLAFEWGNEIEMGWLLDGEWVNPNSHVTVAWMPLPEPWKGADDE